MISALLYLRLKSLQNWLLWRVRRMRQPKYLVGTIVGAAYLYFVFFRRSIPRHVPARVTAIGPAAAVHNLPAEWFPAALAIGSVALAVVFAFMWVVPTERAGLAFSEAEIAFLFPAPVTRRMLVHFRLLTAQLRSLVAGLFMAVISNRWSFLGGNALTHAIGWWFVFSTLNLHFSGAKFTLTRLADNGFNVVVRRLAILAMLLIVVALTVWHLPPDERLPGSEGTFTLLADWVVTITSTAPLSWLLFPIERVLSPFLAPDFDRFYLALAPALLVIALHYFWVARTVVSFEDTSIDQAQRRAAHVAALRSGERRFGRAPVRGRRPPFVLANVGRPEIAFLWKNLLSAWPYFNVRVFSWCALVIVCAATWLRLNHALHVYASGAAIMTAFGAAYLLVMGPQFARQDIRSDFNRIDTLKTYPLAGWQIVLGEMLAPTAILTGIVWLLLLACVLTVDVAAVVSDGTPALRIVGGASLALLVPPVALLQLSVPNAAALLFPSWAEAARTRGGGPEVMGQRMIYFAAQLITMAVVLLPTAGLGAAVVSIVRLLDGSWALAAGFAAPAMFAVLVGEIALVVWWLGQRFERIDVSAELRA